MSTGFSVCVCDANSPGPFRLKVTSQTETMLMTYMLALCLRVDDFATDTELIAHDLGMPAPK